jgi:hypothetical protein
MGDVQTTMGLMEYMKGFNEDSTGWTRYNQGSDGDTLNHTATGMNIVTNRADMRLDLMARNLARGFADLFNMMLKLVCQYQDKEAVVRLRGKWVSVDPRTWKNGFAVTINVGLGTGNRDQQVKQLMALLMEQKQGMQIGIATPENIYNSEIELVKALGFKSADKFWSDPQKNPPPQQPNPEMLKIQAQSQADQQKLQAQDQQHQREMHQKMQLAQFTQQAQDAQTQHQNELQAERERMKMQMDAELAMQKAQIEDAARARELEFERFKAQLQAETQIYIAQLGAGSAQPVETNGNPDNVTNALATSIDGFRAAIEKMGQPKTIIRGPDGRAQGIA